MARVTALTLPSCVARGVLTAAAVAVAGLALGAAPRAAGAQVVDLSGVAAPTSLQRGDTLTVGVALHPAGHPLTSAGVALAYDPAVLRPLAGPIGPLAGPFRIDPVLFPGADVYANDVRPLGDGAALARLVVVAGGGTDGPRTALTGAGVLARIGFRVLGGGADSATVRLLEAGGEGPVYTERGQPGIERAFTVGAPERIAIGLTPGGFLPLEDLTVRAGAVAAIGLRGRADAALRWTVTSRDAALAAATVRDDSLYLTTRPRLAGVVVVDYRAEGDGVVGAGRFTVEVQATPPWLAHAGLRLAEDFDPVTLPVSGFLAADAPGSAVTPQWSVAAAPPLSARLADGAVTLTSAADWAGAGELILRLRAGRDLLDTLTVPVVVEPVNDAPVVHVATSLTALAGVQLAGPALIDLVADVDDELGDLRVTVRGTQVEAWIEAGHLQLRGLRPGPGVVTLQVRDPAGATAVAQLPVEIASPGAAPVLRLPSAMVLAPGAELAVPLQDLVVDLDTPLEALRWQLEAGGAVAAVRVEAQSLVLAAGQAGAGQVDVRVTDDEGNAAAGRWSVVVDAGEATADAGPDDTALEPPAPDGTLPDSTAPDSAAHDTGEPAPPALALALPTRLRVEAGSAAELDVAALVEPAGDGRAFAVAGATFLDARIDGDSGHLRLLAPAGAEGREVLWLTVADATGARAMASLEVWVTALQALRLRGFAEVSLASGEEAVVDLADHVEGADGGLSWSAVVDDAALLETRIEAARLHLRAAADVAGRVAVRIAAEDDAGRRASELLAVQVRGRLEAAADTDLQLAAPADQAVAAGEAIALDLSPLAAAGAEVAWRLVDAGGLTAQLDGTRLSLAAAADAAPGWRAVRLEASTPAGAVVVGFRVAVTTPPRLVLRPAPEATIAAGTTAEVLDLDVLVGVGVADSVRWSVGGGVLVAAVLTPERRLRLDARRALPGREVFDLAAEAGGERRELSLRAVVRAPQVALQPPAAGLVAATDTVVDPSDWVRGEVAPAALRWDVASTPAGVTAAWDSTTGLLSLAGTGDGELRLRVRLTSGLQVVDRALTVRLGPAAPAAGADSLAVADPAPPAAEDAASWSLEAPWLPDLDAGQVLRLPLADLVDGADAGALSWAVNAPEGAAWIDADSLVVSGSQSFAVFVEARQGPTAAPAAVSTLVLVVPVRPPMPPAVELSWGLVTVDGAARLAVRVQADPGSELSLEVGGPGRDAARHAVDAGVPVLLDLPAPGAPVELIAQARRGGLTADAVAAVTAAALADGDELSAVQGRLRLRLSAGAPGSVGVAVDVLGEDLYRIRRAGGSAPLVLRLAAADPAWSTVEVRADLGEPSPAPAARAVGSVWHPLPTTWREGGELVALLPAAAVDGVYRPAVGGIDGPAPRPFPNPFNASVTLPLRLDAGTATRLEIYDVGGRRVRVLGAAEASAVVWDGRDQAGRAVASGVYLFRVVGGTAASGQRLGKLTLLR